MNEIGEIEIRKHLDLTNEPRRLVSGEVIPSENIITAAEVVRAVDDLRTLGVRTLLLTVDYMSGHVLAGLQVLDALREYQRAGGTIVASVPKWAGSMLAPVALIADLVIIGPDAKFYIHSAWSPEDGEGEPGEGTRACNDHMLRFIEARTWTPRAELERCLAHTWNPATRKFEVIQIPALQAVQLGWADDVGGHERARFIAEAVASGLPVTSRRREILAQRPSPPVFEGFSHPGYVRALGAINANLGTVTAGQARFGGFAESGGVVTAGVFVGDNPGGPNIKVPADGIQIGGEVLSASRRIAVEGLAYCINAGSIQHSSSGLVASVSRVDKGVSATPRYVVRIALSASIPGTVLTAPREPAISPWTVVAALILGSSSASQIDIGLRTESGTWMDPNTVGWSFTFIKVAAW